MGFYSNRMVIYGTSFARLGSSRRILLGSEKTIEGNPRNIQIRAPERYVRPKIDNNSYYPKYQFNRGRLLLYPSPDTS